MNVLVARDALTADEVVGRDLDAGDACRLTAHRHPPERERADVDHRVAAVDRDHGAVDVRRVGGEEPGDRTRDLLRRARPAQRHVLGHRRVGVLARRASARARPSRRRPSACAPSPGRRVRPHAGRAVVERDALGQHRERRLRRAVGEARGRRAHAATEATLTIAPRRSSRCGIAARATRNAPVTLVAKTRSKTAGSRSSSEPSPPIPGVEDEGVERAEAGDRLRHRAVGVGARRPTSATIASPSISPRSRSIGPGRRPVTATAYPSAASRRATAAPMPGPTAGDERDAAHRAGPSRSPGRRPCSRR